jgi:arylsulfatase A-like enzyme
VNLADLAPTFLEAAGLKPLPEMTGQSLAPLLEGKSQVGRDMAFVERERHANVRAGDLRYPARAVRTREFLYSTTFARIDGRPAIRKCGKRWVLSAIATARQARSSFWDGATIRGSNPNDPYQITNLAYRVEFNRPMTKLKIALARWMADTPDPRDSIDDDRWDRYSYFGDPPAAGGRKKK